MSQGLIRIAVAVFCGPLFLVTAQAQAGPASETQSLSGSLQQQIDALRRDQQALRNELEEIKRSIGGKTGDVPIQTKPPALRPVTVNVHGESFKGDASARIAMMEFSDFSCSFCAKYARESYPGIQTNYVDTGKIKYFFRDLPETGDTNSILKARTARCAGEQGKFWEMHDLLFATQSEAGAPKLGPVAALLGLDSEKLGVCLASESYTDAIRASIAAARRIGIYGTPAFLIGTLSADGDFLTATNVLVGGESFEVLKSSLDRLLDGQKSGAK